LFKYLLSHLLNLSLNLVIQMEREEGHLVQEEVLKKAIEMLHLKEEVQEKILVEDRVIEVHLIEEVIPPIEMILEEDQEMIIEEDQERSLEEDQERSLEISMIDLKGIIEIEEMIIRRHLPFSFLLKGDLFTHMRSILGTHL